MANANESFIICGSDANGLSSSDQWSPSTIGSGSSDSRDIDTEEEDTVVMTSTDFEHQLNGEVEGEALVDVEKSESQELSDVDMTLTQDLQQDDKELEMLIRALSFTESCNSYVKAQTEEVKTQTDYVESITKDVIQDRDQALLDLKNVEQAFSDVHRKYQRAKLMLEHSKATEDALAQQNEHLLQVLASKTEKSEASKLNQMRKREKMLKEAEAKLMELENDNFKFVSIHRRGEMRVETLESELKFKQKETAQLSTLTDELIGRTASGEF